jgi:hypothetical protein
MTPPNRRLLAVVVASCTWLVMSAILNHAPDWTVGEDGNHRGSSGSCDLQLNELYKAICVYLARFGNGVNPPPHRGEMFWKCLAGECGDNAQHPENYFKRAPFVGAHDILICRYNPDGEPPGTISYRGPTEATLAELKTLLQLSQDLFRSSPLPLACEKPGHHVKAGGWILYTNMSIRFLSGAAYEDAFRRTE